MAEVGRWALEWLLDIRELYHLNRQRLLCRHDPAAFATHDRKLRDAVDAMSAKRDEQLGRKDLHPACRKTLESLSEHWKGLTLFVEHPDVPMDNNRTERTQRGPVVGRKNYYGSGALWSGKLAAMLFSVFATLKLHGINPRQWLTAYLEACAAAGGKVPQNAADFLPWNMSEEVEEALHAPFLAPPEVKTLRDPPPCRAAIRPPLSGEGIASLPAILPSGPLRRAAPLSPGPPRQAKAGEPNVYCSRYLSHYHHTRYVIFPRFHAPNKKSKRHTIVSRRFGRRVGAGGQDAVRVDDEGGAGGGNRSAAPRPCRRPARAVELAPVTCSTRSPKSASMSNE